MHYKKVKTILSSSNGINIFRGCTHGCIYCDSRSSCYQINHDFEDVEVKENALDLLEKELLRKREKCMIGTGSMCDPYCHIETKIQYTRKVLELIDKYNFGIAIQTKSARILRDLDLLKRINQKSKAVVQMTLTTADEELCKILEPNVSTTKERVDALKIFAQNNIPTIVWLCPFLPFINDEEENLRKLLSYCVEAKVKGIIFFGFGLTLREGNREYFYKKLDEYFPSLKKKYMNMYGDKYEINSPNASKLYQILLEECHKHNIILDNEVLFSYMREYPKKYEKISLF